MAKKLVFVYDTPKSAWSALPKDFSRGDTIYEYSGHDYGLCRDDATGGFEVIACSLEPNLTPFFTVPVGLLQVENGEEVHGEYCCSQPLNKFPNNFKP